MFSRFWCLLSGARLQQNWSVMEKYTFHHTGNLIEFNIWNSSALMPDDRQQVPYIKVAVKKMWEKKSQ